MREQCSLAKILDIWALAAAPMGILSWIAFPLLAHDFESDPLAFGVTRIVLLALGTSRNSTSPYSSVRRKRHHRHAHREVHPRHLERELLKAAPPPRERRGLFGTRRPELGLRQPRKTPAKDSPVSGHEPDQRQDQSALGVKKSPEPAKDPI
jgi:hypothetical protein